MKLQFFSTAAHNLLALCRRMPLSVFFTLVLACVAFLTNNIDGFSISFRCLIFIILSVSISLLAMIRLEDCVARWWLRHTLVLVAVMLLGVFCYSLPEHGRFSVPADCLPVFAIGFGAALACLFASFTGRNRDAACWNFTLKVGWQLLVTGVFGMIAVGGLSLGLHALRMLFDMPVRGTAYMNVWIFVMLVAAPLYFMAHIPVGEDKFRSEILVVPLLKVLTRYILIPLLAIYAIILYIYLFQIVLTWTLPCGWVSWLVSALALGCLAVIWLIYPLRMAGDRFSERFSRFVGLLILPLLVLMSIGIIRRIGDYGITINRCYIVLLNVWLYAIFIYLWLSHARHIKYILISPVVCFVLASIGPWSAANITSNTRHTHISKLMSDNLIDVSASARPDWATALDETKRHSIGDAIEYLADYFGKKTVEKYFVGDIYSEYLPKLLRDLDLQAAEDWEAVYSNNEYFSYQFDRTVQESWKLVRVSDFDECAIFSYDNWNEPDTVSTTVPQVVVEGAHLEIKPDLAANPIVFKLDTLIESINADRYDNSSIVISTNDTKLVIINISGHIRPDSLQRIRIREMNGSVFYRKKR